MMRRLLLLLALSVAAIAPLHAEQGAYVLRDTPLRSEPYSDASTLRQLKPKTILTILERRGGWYQARTAARQTGWVRMSAIRLGERQAGGSSGVGETLRFLDSGRSGASGVTVATGIRGLNAADVANATPNRFAVKRLGRYQASASQARAYAVEGRLKSRSVSYMKNQEQNAIPGFGEDW
jgi:hypothetical protein